MPNNYDVAAYIWPSYHEDPRSIIFWPEGFGEWESVMKAEPRFEGHMQPKRPLWGYQNEADPRVMEMQIDAAADYGVNVFIYDWYWYDRRPFLEGCLNDGFLKARNNHRMKFYIMWANHDVDNVWNRAASHAGSLLWEAGVDFKEFTRVCTRLLDNYMGHPCYYTIDGKPVLSIYDLAALVNGLGGLEASAEAVAWFQSEAKGRGFPGVHLQCTARKRLSDPTVGMTGDPGSVDSKIIESLGLGSVTHYQWIHIARADGDYEAWAGDAIKEWDRCATDYSIPYFPHVSIGWDNNPRFKSYKGPVVVDNPPEKFKKYLEKAKAFIDSADPPAPLVTINSWNEWTEASYLLPDKEYKYGYLEAVKSVFL